MRVQDAIKNILSIFHSSPSLTSSNANLISIKYSLPHNFADSILLFFFLHLLNSITLDMKM